LVACRAAAPESTDAGAIHVMTCVRGKDGETREKKQKIGNRGRYVKWRREIFNANKRQVQEKNSHELQDGNSKEARPNMKIESGHHILLRKIRFSSSNNVETIIRTCGMMNCAGTTMPPMPPKRHASLGVFWKPEPAR
jgi:hypothetical protein